MRTVLIYFLKILFCTNFINSYIISTGTSVRKPAALIRSIFAPWFVAVPSAVVLIDAKPYVMLVTAIVAIEFLSTN
jgi:hypothetical protein